MHEVTSLIKSVIAKLKGSVVCYLSLLYCRVDKAGIGISYSKRTQPTYVTYSPARA
jgi:hypothetical protein